MKNKNTRFQIYTLASLILLDFFIQLLYFYHLYYKNPSSLISHWLGIAVMVIVFLWFIISYQLFLHKNKVGYWILCGFLLIEFIFYAGEFIISLFQGYTPFFQLLNHDWILKVVFAIGYINIFVPGYFLFLLLSKKNEFVPNTK